MARGFALGLGVVVAFSVSALILHRLMPAPLREVDYMVIGAVSTLVALGVFFLILITTSLKSGDVFFKKRPKPRR